MLQRCASRSEVGADELVAAAAERASAWVQGKGGALPPPYRAWYMMFSGGPQHAGSSLTGRWRLAAARAAARSQ